MILVACSFFAPYQTFAQGTDHRPCLKYQSVTFRKPARHVAQDFMPGLPACGGVSSCPVACHCIGCAVQRAFDMANDAAPDDRNSLVAEKQQKAQAAGDFICHPWH